MGILYCRALRVHPMQEPEALLCEREWNPVMDAAAGGISPYLLRVRRPPRTVHFSRSDRLAGESFERRVAGSTDSCIALIRRLHFIVAQVLDLIEELLFDRQSQFTDRRVFETRSQGRDRPASVRGCARRPASPESECPPSEKKLSLMLTRSTPRMRASISCQGLLGLRHLIPRQTTGVDRPPGSGGGKKQAIDFTA
jgi:hypothetical protein